MKKLLLILLLLSACSKKEETAAPAICKTCEVWVDYQVNSDPIQHYMESSTKYCDGTWTAVDGKVVKSNGGAGAGVLWKKTKTTTCH